MTRLRSILPGLGFGLAAAALLANGCEDSGTVSKEDAAKATAHAICQSYFDCDCTEHNNLFTSEDQCRADQEADAQRAIDEGDAAGLHYDGRCVDDIIDFVRSVECRTEGQATLEDIANWIEVINCKVYYGDQQGGESCTPLAESNGDDCAQDFRCEQAVCVAVETLPDPGDSCESLFSLCNDGAICLDIDGMGDATCEHLPNSGETCLGAADLCDAGLYCDQGSKNCITSPAEGEACAPMVIQQSQCRLGLVCDGTNCIQAPVGGEPCPLGVCGDGFACNSGTCVVAPPMTCSVFIAG